MKSLLIAVGALALPLIAVAPTTKGVVSNGDMSVRIELNDSRLDVQHSDGYRLCDEPIIDRVANRDTLTMTQQRALLPTRASSLPRPVANSTSSAEQALPSLSNAEMARNVLAFVRRNAPVKDKTAVGRILSEPGLPTKLHVCMEPSKREPCNPDPDATELFMAYATENNQKQDVLVVAHRTADRGVFYLTSTDGVLKKAVNADKTKGRVENLDVQSLFVLGDFRAQLHYWNGRYEVVKPKSGTQ